MAKRLLQIWPRTFDATNFSLDWEDLLKTDELNIDNSTKMYLDKINILLDTYTLLKRINKYKLKFMSKPWINLGLQKSISVIYSITKKDPILKEEFHTTTKYIYQFTLHLYEEK